VYFVNESEGWAMDATGWTWATFDAGSTWTKKGNISGDPTELPVEGWLIFSNSKVGWYSDMSGVWRSEDGGENWSRVYPNDEFSYASLGAQPLSLFVKNQSFVWLGMTNGKVLVTTDGGRIWTSAHLPDAYDVHSLYCFNERHCWAGTWGAGGLYFTDNNGQTWRQLLDEQQRKVSITSVFFTSLRTGWIVATPFYSSLEDVPANRRGVVLKTDDGGETWNLLEGGIYESPFSSIIFTDNQNGWLIGDETVFRTGDSANTWQTILQIK
jgi:photosystem II stability/assembly factor-like uncharacterized protein